MCPLFWIRHNIFPYILNKAVYRILFILTQKAFLYTLVLSYVRCIPVFVRILPAYKTYFPCSAFFYVVHIITFLQRLKQILNETSNDALAVCLRHVSELFCHDALLVGLYAIFKLCCHDLQRVVFKLMLNQIQNFSSANQKVTRKVT